MSSMNSYENGVESTPAQLSELVNLIHSFSSVRRYSNKSLIKDENIAEHSSIVGIITLYLYDRLHHEDRPLVDINKVLAASIFHDFDEIFTGDILNPVKYYDRSIKEKVNEYADLCISKFGETTNFNSLVKYTSSNFLTDAEHCLMKLADIISVFIKFRIENGLGNKLLNVDYKNIIGVLNSHQYKSLFRNSHELREVCDLIVKISLELDDKDTPYSNIMNFPIRG